MPDYSKPVPVPDEQTSGFWDAARQHRLAFQRCKSCGRLAHPPVIICPACNALEPSFEWAEVGGRGAVRSWVVMQDAFVGGFEDDIPWVVVLVQLEEQDDLLYAARLVDGPDAPLRIGAPVEVVFEDVSPETSLPQFRLA